MANINQPTLVLFERARKELNYIPPARSNQVFDVGQGMIVIQTMRDEPDDHKFDLRIQNNTVESGTGVFTFTGSNVDIIDPYINCLINRSAKFVINDTLELKNDAVIINNGAIEFSSNSTVNLYGTSTINIPSTATMTVKDNVSFNTNDEGSISIYGTLNIQYSSVVSFFDIDKNIYVDNGATVNIVGLPTNRTDSLTKFITEMNSKYLYSNVSENRFLGNGFVTFICMDGNPMVPYEISKLVIENGDNVLGDFRLSVVGVPITNTSNLQVLTELIVDKNATLYISEQYRGYTYISPCLFLSQIFANTETPGQLSVSGTVIVDGNNSSIFMDKGGNIIINESGTIIVRNGASIINNYRNEVLIINGTLILDSEDQLKGFNPNDIKIGDNGKIVIMNPNDGTDRIVFSTPTGISGSYLYELFSGKLDHIEYHVQDFDGIKIDMFYDRYTDMQNWYNGVSLERAIFEGYIKWYDDAYIELDHDVIEWVNADSGLLNVSNIFNVFGENNKERLQQVVDRFLYAGVPVLKFKIVDGDFVKYLHLNMEKRTIVDALYDYEGQTYLLITTGNKATSFDNDGHVYLRDSNYVLDLNDIISPESTQIPIINDEAAFTI